MRWRSMVLSGVAAAAVGLTGCSEAADQAIMGPQDAQFNVLQTGYLNVYKFGPAGVYSFEASSTGPGLYADASAFNLAAGAWRTIWSQGDAAAPSSDVTVTELLSEGMQVDSIIVVRFTDAIFTSQTKLTGTNTVTVAGLTDATDVAVKFYNSVLPPPPPPPPGMEGCTPGYWRQTQHFDSWVGYLPGDDFDATFGLAQGTYNGTLLDAVWATGGGANALARHSVAALLNTASAGVDYPATTAEVIAAVQAAFASGDFETQKNIFAGWNELGCGLN